MPKNSHERKRKQTTAHKTSANKAKVTKSSIQRTAVTSHVFKASKELKAQFQELWKRSMQETKTTTVVRDGPMIITTYK